MLTFELEHVLSIATIGAVGLVEAIEETERSLFGVRKTVSLVRNPGRPLRRLHARVLGDRSRNLGPAWASGAAWDPSTTPQNIVSPRRRV